MTDDGPSLPPTGEIALYLAWDGITRRDCRFVKTPRRIQPLIQWVFSAGKESA